MKRLLPTAWLALLALFAPAGARAHNPGLSTLDLAVEPDRFALTLRLTPPDVDADGTASPEEMDAGAALLLRLGPAWLDLADATGPVAFTGPAPELLPAENLVVWRATAPRRGSGPRTLTLRQLAQLSDGHREFVTVTAAGETLAAALLSADRPTLEFSLPVPPPRPDTPTSPHAPAPAPATSASAPPFADFFRLGVEHILTGYDHLLYLAALLLGCRRFRLVLPIVTAFTVAHSLTLALATLGVLNPPAALIEPLIAASIIYVAVENLWLRGREPRRRWAVALGFGLIHGFGFAGLLRDLGVGATPGASILSPLLAFNLGVEAGQLAVIALALPVLVWAARRPRLAEHALPVASSAVAAAGLYWLVERVAF